MAAAVGDCAGVSGLDGGQYGEVVTYLPGRTVQGVVVGDGRVRVQVRSRWGVEAPLLATTITTALAPLTGRRPVDVVIADIVVVVTVTAGHATDLHALHQRLETQALSHVRQAVSNTSLPIRLDLDVSRRTT